MADPDDITPRAAVVLIMAHALAVGGRNADGKPLLLPAHLAELAGEYADAVMREALRK